LIGAAVIVVMSGVFGQSEIRAQEATTAGSQPQSEEPPPPAPSPWSFRVSPYLWFAGLNGDVGVNSNLPVVHVDVGFSDIFKSIDWFPPPAMFVSEVRYGRFGAFTDFMFLGLETDNAVAKGPVAATADLHLDTVVWTFGGSYRVIETDRASLDLLA